MRCWKLMPSCASANAHNILKKNYACTALRLDKMHRCSEHTVVSELHT